MKFVPARHFYPGRLKAVRLIVIHCTVSPEMGTGAEQTAAYFATVTRKASAHRTADNNSVVQSVRDSDTAFGAAGANADGLHLELVGYPTQSTAEWQDAFSLAMFNQATPTIREWAVEFHIPYVWLTVDQVADERTMGFCTHADVSKAFPDVSTGHWDPGPEFPKSVAMDIWRPAPIPTLTPEADVFFASAKANANVWLFETGRRTLVNDANDRAQIAKAAGIPNVVAEISDGLFENLSESRTVHQ